MSPFFFTADCLDLQQRLRLGLDIRTKVHRVPGVTSGHEGQLARSIVDEEVGEVVAADDVGRLLLGFRVTSTELVHINGQ